MPGEFDLIEHYFAHQQPINNHVQLTIGDDCAIVDVPHHQRLVVTTDTMVEGTHFIAGANPAWIAHKALASNLSDIAAMGGRPVWCSLALTLPELNASWLEDFSRAFFSLANHHQVMLIGGDTTKGPLAITMTLHGWIPRNQALTRKGAQIGDYIYVTGELGDSKAGLEVILNRQANDSSLGQTLEKRHYVASPRVNVGILLLDIASAAIDISDGLVADLGHILAQSDVGAEIEANTLPLSNELLAYVAGDRQRAYQYALTSGEEYELCFTVPEHRLDALHRLEASQDVPFTCIGRVTASGVLEVYEHGRVLTEHLNGYDHFGEND